MAQALRKPRAHSTGPFAEVPDLGDVSIVICTANRASDLRATLASLATVRTPGRVELLVIDNRSVDETRRVVNEAAESFPFPVRYFFESEAGKYAALNAGIRASRGSVIAATDDDARFEADWLERAVEGLARYNECGFVGGRVRPIWGGEKPAWLNERSSTHMKVIAILDHGADIREFGRGIGWPLGVNVAYRRDVFERVGLFDNRLGRKWGTLRNQAQREWHLRARVAGVRGVYLPEMIVHHLVPRDRLNRRYFRRWLYWNGISRAILNRQGGFDIEEPDLESPPNAGARELGGVPHPLWWKAARSMRGLAWHTLRGNAREALRHELWLCFFAGVVRQRWSDRNRPVGRWAGDADGCHAPGAFDPIPTLKLTPRD
jgi:glycosyltransferase involved in cell wall biosynthesis